MNPRKPSRILDYVMHRLLVDEMGRFVSWFVKSLILRAVYCGELLHGAKGRLHASQPPLIGLLDASPICPLLTKVGNNPR